MNRTMTLSSDERELYAARLVHLARPADAASLKNTTINQDLFAVLDYLPSQFVDLLFIDPPYNINKAFGGTSFKEMTPAQYTAWLETWLPRLLTILKSTASVYICSDWRSSGLVQAVAEKHLIVQNRITWERDKGRGAKANWKNCLEDILFCTISKEFHFNADAVRLKRRVIAPYKDADGKPKDWDSTADGDFRLTCPSNLWTDLTVPFWSMPENTDHPTQKPEKLLAKIILASSREGDFVFDPFLGSGTTSVVAKKLGRFYCGVEIDADYCCLAEKRLAAADFDSEIQGYSDGVFWERNTGASQPAKAKARVTRSGEMFPYLREELSNHAK